MKKPITTFIRAFFDGLSSPCYRTWIYTLLVCLSTLLYFLSFTYEALAPIAFVALVPFFYVLKGSISYKRIFFYGFFMGSLLFSSMAYWLIPSLVNQYSKPLELSLVFVCLAGLLPIGTVTGLFALAHRFLHRNTLLFHAFVVPSLWVISEYLREAIDLLVPWGFIGYSVLPCTNFVQMADVCGVYGVSFIVVMVNALLVYKQADPITPKTSGQESQKGNRSIRIPLILNTRRFSLTLIFFSILIPVLYGIYQKNIFALHRVTGSVYTATIVQGNFDQKDRWSGMGFQNRLNTYLAMSRRQKNKDSNIFVWPETVLNQTTNLDGNLFKRISHSLGKSTLLIAGGLRGGDDGSGLYNTAYVLSETQDLTWYDKQRLLPYAEFKAAGSFLGSYYSAPAVFLAGTRPSVVQTAYGLMGISICVEILYPGYIRQSVHQGAGFLVNLSNDTWFGNSSMPETHLRAARFRAIENRRFLLRASNSGISAVITPSGDVSVKSSLFARETITALLSPSEKQTFYTQWGDWVLLCSVFILMGALVRSGFFPPKQD